MHFFLSPHSDYLSWIQFAETISEPIIIFDILITILKFIQSCFKHLYGTFWRYGASILTQTLRGEKKKFPLHAYKPILKLQPVKQMRKYRWGKRPEHIWKIISLHYISICQALKHLTVELVKYSFYNDVYFTLLDLNSRFNMIAYNMIYFKEGGQVWCCILPLQQFYKI